MEASFWHEKWEIGQIGFHNSEVHPLLVNHIDKLDLNDGDRIFLPLCGKTLDIAYLLKQDYQVVGVELSELAIKELFEELKLTPSISKVGALKLYQADNIDIFVGDFFELSTEIIKTVDAVYDRASFIALPKEMRSAYKTHLVKITQSTRQLLVCLEYDQSKLNGPPFAINPDEVQQQYEANYSLNCVERNEIIGGIKGKTAGYESAWILKSLGL